jgi:hypothetical protein
MFGMTKQEAKELAKRFKQLSSIIDDLWRKDIKNKAWISALKTALTPLISKETGKSEKEVRLVLIASMKAFLQKELESLENLDPALAAQLDARSIEEV